MTIKEVVLRVLQEETEAWGERGPIPMTANLVEDLLMDSFQAIGIVFALEEDFAIDIPDEDAEKWVMVGDVVTYLEGVI